MGQRESEKEREGDRAGESREDGGWRCYAYELPDISYGLCGVWYCCTYGARRMDYVASGTDTASGAASGGRAESLGR